MKNKHTYIIIVFMILFASCSQRNDQVIFKSNWAISHNQTWVGSDFWANRLQDWRIKSGKLECTIADTNKPMRTVHWLTGTVTESIGNFKISVRTGKIGSYRHNNSDAATGFIIGLGDSMDYRSSALIQHSNGKSAGIFVGVNCNGDLFIQDREKGDSLLASKSAETELPEITNLILKNSLENGINKIILVAESDEGKLINKLIYSAMQNRDIIGNIALVSHPGKGNNPMKYWFSDLNISGNRIKVLPEHKLGPVLSTQYTVSKNILKLTAQLLPIGETENQEVLFQIKEKDKWETKAKSEINRAGYFAPFRIENWNDTKEYDYRVLHTQNFSDETEKKSSREGIIKKNPIDKENIVVATFTGNHNVGRQKNARWGIEYEEYDWQNGVFFPHSDLKFNVKKHSPDLLFFSGDQVYEGASPTSPDYLNAELDYLYKWYLWCWAFRDLTENTPTVTIPDDHDVFHGNIWGESGNATEKGFSQKVQDSGGYKMSPSFVNMVQTTQTSHLPDPYDTTPVKQGIGVYYTDLNWGGVSFAIIEDRKFKSSPTTAIPNGNIVNGWALKNNFDAKSESDVPNAKLLGDRQLLFMEKWISDWSNNIWMKALLSQTIFANVATLPQDAINDAIVPKLPVLEPGSYPSNDIPVSDFDSNSWPKSRRDRVVRILQKGFAVHIAGDQHLGSTIQYGIDDWREGGFAICVPSIANFWPRRWFPKFESVNPLPGLPKYCGDFEDGFGSKFTVHAVSNPYKTNKEPNYLHDLAPGYGIINFNKITREITFSNWSRWADPEKDSPYPGWPVVVKQEENYGKETKAYLPTFKVKGLVNPIFQIIDEDAEEIIYTIRINGQSYQPKVFKKGKYTVVIGELATNYIKNFRGIIADKLNDNEVIEIEF